MKGKIVKAVITKFSADFFSDNRKNDQMFGSLIYSENEYGMETQHNVVIVEEKSFTKNKKIEFEGRITAQQGHGWMSVNDDPCTVVIDQTVENASYIQYVEAPDDDF